MDEPTPAGAAAPTRIMANAPRQPVEAMAPTATAPPRQTAPAGFWAFLRTLFIGSAGLAVLAVAGTLGGSAWLTANQRAEADKAQPWADPSFTTTAVTTGGLLARWMDNDGNLENGHTYVKGIYDLWKVKNNGQWQATASNPRAPTLLPQLWQAEFNTDLEKLKQQTVLRRDTESAERERIAAEVRRRGLEAELSLAGPQSWDKGLQKRTPAASSATP